MKREQRIVNFHPDIRFQTAIARRPRSGRQRSQSHDLQIPHQSQSLYVKSLSKILQTSHAVHSFNDPSPETESRQRRPGELLPTAARLHRPPLPRLGKSRHQELSAVLVCNRT